MDLADLDYCLDLFKGTSQCHSMQRRPRHGNQTFAEIQIPSKLDNFLWKLNFDDFLKSLWKVGKGSFLIQNKSLQIFHCENISERGAQFQSNCFCCKLTKIYKKNCTTKFQNKPFAESRENLPSWREHASLIWVSSVVSRRTVNGFGHLRRKLSHGEERGSEWWGQVARVRGMESASSKGTIGSKKSSKVILLRSRSCSITQKYARWALTNLWLISRSR